MIVCVGAVVVWGCRVLFVRQTYGGLRGKWTLPWGFVQGGGAEGPCDYPDVAVLRETLEEGGVVAEVEGLLGIQNHTSRRTGEARLYVLFLCRLKLQGLHQQDLVFLVELPGSALFAAGNKLSHGCVVFGAV